MRAAIYTRVSSEEQVEGYSLEAQLEACRALCEYRKWQVASVYEERGRSGKTVIRPEFQRMIAAAESREFDVIVVHKLDRFSRSLLDVLQYLNRLHLHDVSFVSATEDFDFSTPFGKLILAVLGAFAQWYIDNLSAETRKGKRQRAKSGGWNGTLSFGYTTLRQMRKDLQVMGEQYRAGQVPEQDYSAECDRLESAIEQYAYRYETAAVPHFHNRAGVVLAYETYATGLYSDTDVAWKLNGAGYRTTGNWGQNVFGKDTVTWMLQNRFYIGETSYRGKQKGSERQWIPGDHEPIISRELFERCQTVRRMRATTAPNSSPKRNVQPYPLTPLLVCLECGANYRGWNLRGERRYRDPARDLGLCCDQSPKSVKAGVLESQVDTILRDMLVSIPADWQRLALDHARKQQAQAVSPSGVDVAKLQGRLDRAKKLFVMGDITEGDYHAIRNEITAMMPASADTLTPEIDLRYVGELLQDFGSLWRVATLEERKVLLQHLFATLYVESGEIVAVEPTATLWTIQSCGKMNQAAAVTLSDNGGDTSVGSDGCRIRRGYHWVLPGTPRAVVARLVA